MNAARAHFGSFRRNPSRRPFHAHTSLAAGTAVEPNRGLWIALLCVTAGAISVLAGRAVERAVGYWALWLAYPAWVLVVWMAHQLRVAITSSAAGNRRGDVRQTTRVERSIAAGIRGPDVSSALAIAVIFGYCVCAFVYATASGMNRRPEAWGWVPAPAWVVVLTYGLPLVWVAFAAAPRMGRGRLVVSWPTLPLRTGARHTFRVGASPRSARIDGVRVFLRCVRVRHRPFVPLAAWNAQLAWIGEARLPLGAHAGPDGELVAEFDVPAAAPPTDLTARETVHWEVLVIGTVRGSDFALTAPVPVLAS